MDDMDVLRERIESLLKERGMSARALSLAIGQNPAYIQQLISGMRNKKPPRMEIMFAIADKLDVPLTEIYPRYARLFEARYAPGHMDQMHSRFDAIAERTLRSRERVEELLTELRTAMEETSEVDREFGELKEDLDDLSEINKVILARLEQGDNPMPPPQRKEDEIPPRDALLQAIGAWPVIDHSLALDILVSAGAGHRAHIPQGVEGIETVPFVRGRQLYALRVTGNCMSPEINPGDVVRFDPDHPAEDGDLVVATKDGEKALVKWLDRQATLQYLLPLNGDPILIDESIQIVGVVKDVVRQPPPRKRRPKHYPVPEGQKSLAGD